MLNGHVLSILNWTGQFYAPGQADLNSDPTQDRLRFSGDVAEQNLSQVHFFDDNGTQLASAQEISFTPGGFELVPIPEPTTIFGALGLLGLVGYRERRRVAKIVSKFAPQALV
jgi:hypothetical protein